MGGRPQAVNGMEIDLRFEETEKGGRYVMTMPNGELSRISYVRAGTGTIIADSTFVPEPYRGDGVAEAMVERLMADARVRGLKVIPACWFVADEMTRRSPEWDDIRAG